MLAVVAAAAGGCTVKEDRQRCPCFLDLDYRAMLAKDLLLGEPGTMDVAVFLPELACRSSYSIEDCPEVEEQSVPRSEARVIGVLSSRRQDGVLDSGTKIVYDAGNQIDSVYVHSSVVDCSGEEAVCELHPLKQFSTVFLTDEEDGAILRKYNLVVKGTTCGLDALDLSALSGEYLYTVQEYDRDGGVSVRIPRQTDSRLILEFYDKETYQHLFSAPLGTYLFDAGYDTEAEELQDYTFKINFEQTLVYLRIAGWEEEFIYKLFK